MDKKFINNALNLAKKNLGLTAPNPVVGCVIVKNGEIIATGVTAISGRPHAENIAIAKVRDKTTLEGATLYVTLEPCCHFGQTEPCTDLIIASKIKKVVIAIIDPYAKVNGGGIQKLRDAGIEVICSIMEQEAREINRAFFKTQETGLPFITLKLATSLDGKIATKNFHSKWISSEKAREFSHYLRAQNDAIMIGADTLRQDNPALDCRLAGLSEHSPKKIIIARDLNFDEKLQIFQNVGKIPTLILTNQNKDSKHIANVDKFKNLGVEIIFCDDVLGKINLESALRKIAASGINSVLVEGGKNLATQLLNENLADELIWIQNKKIIGEDGISAIGDCGVTSCDQALQRFARQEVREIGADDLVSFYRKI